MSQRCFHFRKEGGKNEEEREKGGREGRWEARRLKGRKRGREGRRGSGREGKGREGKKEKEGRENFVIQPSDEQVVEF